MSDAPRLVGRDGARYPLADPRWCGDDGSPLMVEPLPGITPDEVNGSVNSQWRYAAALPTAPAGLAPVSLGEGNTALLDVTLDDTRLLIKPEWQNPTGSFKDRGTSVMMSVLAQQGIDRILEDSSGNGGASVAAYAAAADIDALILAPESTSAAKTLQARVHGARVELVPGSRQATADEALRRASQRFYASHNWHPFFLQGIKLLAYEIWENLGFHAPDAVLVPAGAGSLVLGCWLGFGELVRSGQIDALPRILAVQPRNCSPLAAAFATGEEGVRMRDWPATIAEGTAIAAPVRDLEVLAAVRESAGAIVTVAEKTIAPAVRVLAGRGLYVEPTCATVVAALLTLREQGMIADGDEVVAVLTGTGLKSGPLMERILRGD